MSLASDALRFIFVRVPRTGSSTYCHYLQGCFGPLLVDRGAQHASAAELRRLWGDKWNAYRTFGVVRNPWDWLVSFYHSGVSASPGPPEAWQGSRITRHDEMRRSNMDFEAFVRQRKTTPVDWLSDGGRVIVDEVLRFEDLVKEWRVQWSAMPRRQPASAWYTADLARYVAEAFPRAVEIGGYAFEDVT